jgi:preprotein translocase subunit SecB
MEIKKQPKLQFKGVDIVNVNFSTSQQIDKANQPELDLQIVPKIFYPQDRPDDFTVIFDVKIIAQDYFELSLIAFGMFEFGEDAEEEERKKLANINTAAIMFPYIRAFVSTLTANLGASFIPIVLPPHFFKGELEEFVADEPIKNYTPSVKRIDKGVS